MAECRQDECSFQDRIITEKYSWKKNYTGQYTSDGKSCNCAWYASRDFCRHIILYRKFTNMPMFEEDMLQPKLLKQNSSDSTALGSNTNTPEDVIEDLDVSPPVLEWKA